MKSRGIALACVLILAVPLIVLSAAIPAAAQCTDALLQGRYLYTFNGIGWDGKAGVRPEGASYGFAAAGHMILNGVGGGSGQDTMAILGQIIPRAYNVQYSIASDCTGTMTLQFEFGEGPANIVVSNDGRDVLFINTIPGVTVTGRLLKVPEQAGGCSTGTLSGSYMYMPGGSGLNGQGNAIRTASSAAFASVGRISVVEPGRLEGVDTISFGGLIIPRQYTTTYEVNTDCSGRFLPGDLVPADIYVAGDGSVFVVLSAFPGTIVSGWYERK